MNRDPKELIVMGGVFSLILCLVILLLPTEEDLQQERQKQKIQADRYAAEQACIAAGDVPTYKREYGKTYDTYVACLKNRK